MFAVVILMVAGFVARGSARRNWAYVQLLHGRVEPWHAYADAAPATDRPGQLARLRAALQRGVWPDVSRMLSLLAAGPDRLAPLLVIQDAERRAATGEVTAARAALRCVSEQPGTSPRCAPRSAR